MADIIKFLSQTAPTVAPELIGWRLYSRESDGQLVGGTIVETEAYTQDDTASHSCRGRTKRNQIMFGPAGRLYVYFTYGMYWCANIVTGPVDRGEAVLIRALKPDQGLEIMRERRHNRELTNGPAKLCQALSITGRENGIILNEDRIILLPPIDNCKWNIESTPRIGIKNDTGRLWRFVAK